MTEQSLKNKTIQRNSNLELYRIIVMLLIVAHHYVVNSGVMHAMQENPTSLPSLYYYILGAWGKVGINCFVLITGYFMCTSSITLKKFLKLFTEVCFYLVAVNAIFFLSGYEALTLKNVWSDMQLLLDVSQCFTSCFIMFYLFIPFLNTLVHNMTRRQHLYLIVLCLSIFSGIATFILGHVAINYVVWFCILYFIASYLRMYQPMKQLHWGHLMGGALFLSLASIIMILFIAERTGYNLPQYHFISDSNKLLAVLLSVCSFMYFKDLRIPQSKVINRIAQSCFGVLLIHANSDAMRQWLWKDILNVEGQYRSDNYVWYSLLSVLSIYIICTMIDQLRIICIEKPLFNYMDKRGWI